MSIDIGDPSAQQLNMFKVVTVDRNILKVLSDILVLKKGKKKFKREKIDSLPPLTDKQKQFTAIREVYEELHSFHYEIQDCVDQRKERQEQLDEVINVSEAYKTTILSLSKFIKSNNERKSRVLTQMETDLAQLKEYSAHNDCHVKCAKLLLQIRSILQTVVKENNLYAKFTKSIADQYPQYQSTQSVTERHTVLANTKARLAEKHNERMLKIQEYRDNIFREDHEGLAKLLVALQRVQQIGIKLKQIKTKTSRFEDSINRIRTQSVEEMVKICQVLKSVENMVAKLIKYGIATEELETMTLSKQLEIIRKEHLKQCAILKEFTERNTVVEKRNARRILRLKNKEIFDNHQQANLRSLKQLQTAWKSLKAQLKRKGPLNAQIAALGLEQQELALLEANISQTETVGTDNKRIISSSDELEVYSSESSTISIKSDTPSVSSLSDSEETDVIEVIAPVKLITQEPSYMMDIPLAQESLEDQWFSEYGEEEISIPKEPQQIPQSIPQTRKKFPSFTPYTTASLSSESTPSGDSDRPLITLNDIRKYDQRKLKELKEILKPKGKLKNVKTDYDSKGSSEEESDDESFGSVGTLSVDSSVESLPSQVSNISLDTQESND